MVEIGFPLGDIGYRRGEPSRGHGGEALEGCLRAGPVERRRGAGAYTERGKESRAMNKSILEGLGKLLRVKSLVTLALTAVFAVMALKEDIPQDFMTIYAVIISFYFGTQSQKMRAAMEGKDG